MNPSNGISEIRPRLQHNLLLFTACMAIVLSTSGFQCEGTGGGGTGTNTPPQPAEMITACCSGGNPTNYLKTNDNWDPTSCGTPSSISYNVCTYRRFDNKLSGAIMVVCAGQPLPSGWVTQDYNWDPTSCGHPSSIIDNMMTIRKL